MRALCSVPGRLKTRKELLKAGWDEASQPATPNALDQQIWGLRRKFPEQIISVRGQGWFTHMPLVKD
jgi:DNA-binding response OmpR family regulator